MTIRSNNRFGIICSRDNSTGSALREACRVLEWTAVSASAWHEISIDVLSSHGDVRATLCGVPLDSFAAVLLLEFPKIYAHTLQPTMEELYVQQELEQSCTAALLSHPRLRLLNRGWMPPYPPILRQPCYGLRLLHGLGWPTPSVRWFADLNRNRISRIRSPEPQKGATSRLALFAKEHFWFPEEPSAVDSRLLTDLVRNTQEFLRLNSIDWCTIPILGDAGVPYAFGLSNSFPDWLAPQIASRLLNKVLRDTGASMPPLEEA